MPKFANVYACIAVYDPAPLPFLNVLAKDEEHARAALVVRGYDYDKLDDLFTFVPVLVTDDVYELIF